MNEYNIFLKLFSNLVFTKINPNPTQIQLYSTYAVRLQVFVGNGYRYIFVFVPLDVSLKNQVSFEELYPHFVSIQTRLLDTYFNIPEQAFDYRLFDPRYDNNKYWLMIKDRTLDKTEYYSTIPIELEILHDKRKKSSLQYPDKLELRNALNTFQCILKKI
jgi:hypothetical protein